MSREELQKIHNMSIFNGDIVAKSKVCGCFFCGQTFTASEAEFINEASVPPEHFPFKSQKTAICPYCNIDSVLSDGMNLEINDKLLDEMHKEFFETFTKGDDIQAP